MSKNELSQTGAGILIHGSSGSAAKYLASWVDTHRSTFDDCMERLADELPQKYCELYLKMIQIAAQHQPAPKQTNIDTMNVNVTSKLDALSDVHDTSWRKDNNYTQYEEVANGK